MDKIESFINNWSEKKRINGKSFDEMFQIEGIPLWWFLRGFFEKHVVPKPINTFDFIKDKRKLTILDKVKFSINVMILKKYLFLNENRKIRYMKKIKIDHKKNNKVLFLTYTHHLSGDGKIFRLQKIVEVVRKDKELNEFILFVDPLSKRSHKKIAHLKNIYKYYDEDLSKKAKNISNDLFYRWKNISLKTKRELCEVDNLSLWPYMKYTFDLFFSKEFLFFLVLYYKMCKKILITENIKIIVITGRNSLFEKCILAASKHAGIPSLLIQHGFGLVATKEDIVPSTKVAVFNDYFKKKLIKQGIKKENIYAVGAVIFDEAKRYAGEKKKKGKNILIVTATFVEDNLIKKKIYFQRIERILKELTKIKEGDIVMKLHPREIYLKEYKRIIKNNRFNRIKIYRGETTRDEFYKLIYNCDCFVHFGSGAAFEAMMIDRPIVTINLLDDAPTTITKWIEDEDVTLNIDYKDNVKKAAERALSDEKSFKIKRKKYIKDHFGTTDGKASERVVKIIKKTIK